MHVVKSLLLLQTHKFLLAKTFLRWIAEGWGL